MTRAIDSMRAGLAGPLSLADLARAGRYSPFHFHRIFREVTGVTPARFLAGLRMAEARRLLMHTGVTVAEVSRRVGYVSLGTFTTQFGRLVGLAPHRFRQLMRELREMTVGSLLAAAPAPTAATPGRCTLALAGDAHWPALVIAGLCPAGSLGDGPGWWTIASGTRQVRLPVQPAFGNYSAVVVVVPAQARLTDAFVDEVAGSFLIGLTHVTFPLTEERALAVPVALRGPRTTDPPVLATAPVRWLAERLEQANPRVEQANGSDRAIAVAATTRAPLARGSPVAATPLLAVTHITQHGRIGNRPSAGFVP